VQEKKKLVVALSNRGCYTLQQFFYLFLRRGDNFVAQDFLIYTNLRQSFKNRKRCLKIDILPKEELEREPVKEKGAVYAHAPGGRDK